MIDIKALLPMVKPLLPDESEQEIIAGLKQLAVEHPDLDNQQALQAIEIGMKPDQSQETTGQNAKKPFEGLMNALGSK